MRSKFLVILICSLLSSLLAQNSEFYGNNKLCETLEKQSTLANYVLNDTIELDQSEMRTIFISFLHLGYPELFAYKCGYQINRKWAFTLKGNLFLGRDNKSAGFGIGGKVSNYFDKTYFYLVNNSAFEFTLNPEYGKINGCFMEINTGYESIQKSWFAFYFSVGLAAVIMEEDFPFYTATFKIGINLNF